MAKSLEEREQIKELRRLHIAKQRKQREKYYKHKRKATENPNKYMSIIMDGMDQKKINLPVMGHYTKTESPLTQRIIGVRSMESKIMHLLLMKLFQGFKLNG